MSGSGGRQLDGSTFPSQMGEPVLWAYRRGPNTRETSRMLIPSTITARRTRRYTSTWYIHPTTHKHDFEPMDGTGRYIFQPPQCRRPAKKS